MAFSIVTVHGRYSKPVAVPPGVDPVPAKGHVTFVLSTTLQDPATNDIVAPVHISVPLDATGSFTTELVATDDLGVVPTGATYLVTEHILKADPRSYSIVVPNAAVSLDLADVAPAVPGPLLTGYALQSALSAEVTARAVGDVATLAAAEAYADAIVGGAALQPLDSDLTAIAALSTTAFGRGLLTLADPTAARTDLALGSAATAATGDFDPAGAASAAQAASQPLDSDLTAIAALSTTAFGRGLLALADAAAGRTAFGLGSAALAANGDFDAAGSAAAAQAASQPLDSDLTAIAALSTTAFGRALLALADAAALRTAAGLGTAATAASTDFDAAGSAAAAQAASQPLDSDLTAIAALATTSFGRSFLALADAAAGRTLLALGTAATQASSAFDASGAAAAAQAASQPLDSDLTAIAALSTTAFGRSVLDRADAAALRILAGLGNVDNTADTAKPVSTAQQTALDGKMQALARTAVKTSSYSAAAGDLVPVDTTGGAVTVTLPNAPADKSMIAVKHIIQGGTNAVTIACAGSDVFNRTGGGTSATLPYANQAMLLEYTTTGAIWSVIADDLPLSQLDLRFAPITGIAESAVTNLVTDLAAKADLVASSLFLRANF